MIRAGDRCSGLRQPNGRITRRMKLTLLIRVVPVLALTFTLAFSLALTLPLAVLAFTVLALIILLGSFQNGGRGDGEQQRAATNDASQETAAGCIDLIDQL